MIRSFSSYLYVLVYVAAQSVALAQQTPTFGLALDMKTARRSRELLAGDFNGDGIQDIAVVAENGLQVHLQAADSLGFRIVQTALKAVPAEACAANLNGDRITDIVLLFQNPAEIHAFVGRSGGTLTEKWAKALRGSEHRINIGDITSDGRNDILLFGRKEPGVTVFPGTGAGTFRQAQTILEDAAFSHLEVVDYNNDRMNDVIGINWLSNEVNLFLAYSRMKYGNASILPFDTEPALLVPAPLDSTGLLGLVVGLTGDRSLRIYGGNGFGEFTMTQELVLDALPTEVAARDADGDGDRDLLVLSREGRNLTVWLNAGNGTFDDQVNFSAGKAPVHLAVFNHGTGGVNAALLDTAASRLRVIFHSDDRRPENGDVRYVTGLSPSGITAADVNHDGRTDLLVANTASQDFSVFLNNATGGLQGQLAFPVVMSPTQIQYFANPDNSGTILLAGKYEEKAMLVDVNIRTGFYSTYTIPTQPDPVFLGRLPGSQPGMFDLYAKELERSTQQMFLTKFEQVAPKRFIEKNLTPAAPFLAAAVSRQREGRGVLYLATYNDPAKTITVSRTDPAEARKNGHVNLFSIPVPGKTNAFLWLHDVNRDGIEDMIINLRAPENSLMVAQGDGIGNFSAPRAILSDEISVATRYGMKIADINGDGNADVIVENDLDRSIQAYIGRGNGSYMPKMRLISSIGIGGFEVVDITGNGIPELVLLDTSEGLLRVIRLNQ